LGSTINKEKTMANERNEGVIMDELELVEMEEVVAPAILLAD
jgi:hypothetical protein